MKPDTLTIEESRNITMNKPIERALISVSDKTNIAMLASFLANHHVEVLSTGGTARALRDAGAKVIDISEYTGFPEMLDGRVKTLHPRVHGGLLGRRDQESHLSAMKAHDIPQIDLVIVNLYPFEETISKMPDNVEACIENIDIGGPSMIRSASKNHDAVTVITDPKDYALLQEEMDHYQGSTSLAFRQKMAAKAFTLTARYDAAIASWMTRKEASYLPQRLTVNAEKIQELRYGENPHQYAAVYGFSGEKTVLSMQKLQGKELSYNNILDADAALSIVTEFNDPAAIIIKHTNPCGSAIGTSIEEAYERALSCDDRSAFGGIVAVNREITASLAQHLVAIFLEIVMAPSITSEAAEILSSKKNLRLLIGSDVYNSIPQHPQLHTIRGGILAQAQNHALIGDDGIKVVTKKQPTDAQMKDLLFAFTICKHVKSNAIVLAKDGRTTGVGAGQMSRVDSTFIACHKTQNQANVTDNLVLASDAFFPFADSIEEAAAQGVVAIIQPGGSIRDKEVIEAADKHGIAMVFTGMRHFQH